MSSATAQSRLEPPPARARTASNLQRRRARLRALNNVVSLAGTLPAVAWYLIFLVGPLAALFWLSVNTQEGMLGDSTFVGFKNFVRVFSDPNFLTATTNTILQIVVLVPILMVLSLLMAHYLHRRPRGHNVLATIFFVPAILSVAARSMAFVAILAPAPFGLLNNVLGNLGLQHLERAWLADDQTALWCVVLVELWGGIGFTAILLEARMASVPYEVEEAATLDGVSQRGMLWRILYPMIRDYFGVLVTLQFIWTLFTSAGDVLLLTGGGPGYASTNLAYLIYTKAFMQQDLGYATAVAVLLFFVGLIGSLSIRAAFRPAY